MAEEPKTLQSLLVEKTGEPAEDVRERLQKLQQKIEDAVEAGERFTIDGFGTFSGETGTLSFEPSDRLETEINQKYAGMQPVELVEAFKESGAGVPLEPVEQETSQEEEEPLSEFVDDSAEAETDEEETADAPIEEDEETPALVESDAADEQENHPDLDEQKKRRLPNRHKNSQGAWIAAAAIFIIVILVVGWLFFTHRLSPGKGNSHIATSQPVDPVKVDDVPVSQENSSKKINNEKSAETNKAGSTKMTLSDSSPATYGLHGGVNKQLEGAYTIVIHSFQLKSTVQDIAENLRHDGYRAVIFSGKISGDVHWRVGLGQFKTIEAAEKAVKKLPERYQKAHFIHQIN